MRTAEVLNIEGGQAVRLPEDFHFDTGTVWIRREGHPVILEPVKPATWLEGSFEAIRIDDVRFVRPDQGCAPPILPLD